jgi:hypothetical protein
LESAAVVPVLRVDRIVVAAIGEDGVLAAVGAVSGRPTPARMVHMEPAGVFGLADTTSAGPGLGNLGSCAESGSMV